jgi:hypothetical protein
MKKLILFAAMAAIAVSCAKTGEVNPVSEQAIGFDTWTSNLTKATTTTTPHTPFTAGSKFNVYGYKYSENEESPTTVFNGDVVRLDDKGAWNYTGIRFWDRTTDYYNFFAIAPDGNVPTTPDTPGLFVTKNIDFNGTSGDILVAKKKSVAKANYGLTVDLEFVPQAALLDLKVKKAINLKEAELTIESVAIKNIQTKGYLTVSSYANVGGKPSTSWTLAEPNSVTDFENTVELPLVIASGVEHGIINSRFLIENLIVMPQSLNLSQQLEIKYTITFSNETVTHTRTIDLNKFDSSDVDQTANRDEDSQNAGPFIESWDPGKHYTYYLTINADLIVFTATISDWIDQEAFHYIIN